MTLTLRPVVTGRDLRRFVTFPWRIYRDDPNWVPPLIAGQVDKLDPARNPFWRNAERELWMAFLDGRPAGTIAAIIDHAANRALGKRVGAFGFFECVNDPAVARGLLDAAAQWLAARGMSCMRGPFSPSTADEFGLLIEGHDTRPALLEAHTPRYYVDLVEAAGFAKRSDALAWLVRAPPQARTIEEALPPKLLRVAGWARARLGAAIRTVDTARWDEEIALACRIYNAALGALPEYVPMPEQEFARFAASFRPLLSPDMALLAEVDGRPAGFTLALPDFNEALQHAGGRLRPFGALRVWWRSRRLRRASFKILVVLPEFWGRGLEALLIVETARAIWARGFREVDLSLTGEDNENVHRLLEGLGFRVYRRYRVFEKGLPA